jgi:hypothetical protein
VGKGSQIDLGRVRVVDPPVLEVSRPACVGEGFRERGTLRKVS